MGIATSDQGMPPQGRVESGPDPLVGAFDGQGVRVSWTASTLILDWAQKSQHRPTRETVPLRAVRCLCILRNHDYVSAEDRRPKYFSYAENYYKGQYPSALVPDYWLEVITSVYDQNNGIKALQPGHAEALSLPPRSAQLHAALRALHEAVVATGSSAYILEGRRVTTESLPVGQVAPRPAYVPQPYRRFLGGEPPRPEVIAVRGAAFDVRLPAPDLLGAGAALQAATASTYTEALLALGPPRSGKTSGVIIPQLLSHIGPAVVTSTKPDVLDQTWRTRARLGQCWLYDPTGTVDRAVQRLRWSPVTGCQRWDDAVRTARAMTTGIQRGGDVENGSFWYERAEALLAAYLHAAALAGKDMPQLLAWVDRATADEALRHLRENHARIAEQSLAGIDRLDERPRSSIYATLSSVLNAYHLEGAQQSLPGAEAADRFDPHEFVQSTDTVYICAGTAAQAIVAPLVVGFLDAVREAQYRKHGSQTADPSSPVLGFFLDELANVAPIRDLDTLLSQGAGQGLRIVGCLQDLSQARLRWGPLADGMLTLFGHAVVLRGISDPATLEAVSLLSGEREVEDISRSHGSSVGTSAGMAAGGIGGEFGAGVLVQQSATSTNTTTSTPRIERRLKPHEIAHGDPGEAVFVDRGQATIGRLLPAHSSATWQAVFQESDAWLAGAPTMPLITEALPRAAQRAPESRPLAPPAWEASEWGFWRALLVKALKWTVLLVLLVCAFLWLMANMNG